MILKTTYTRHSRLAYAVCSYVPESTVLALLCWSEYPPMPSCLRSPICRDGWRNDLCWRMRLRGEYGGEPWQGHYLPPRQGTLSGERYPCHSHKTASQANACVSAWAG